MKRMGFAFLGLALFAGSAVAQSQAGAQAGAQTNAQANAQANKQGAQANASGAAASSAAAQTKPANAALASGSTFNAALNAPVDSKKCKPGDQVTAHTTEATKSEGKTVMPKGTKLVGHVTQASARANGESDSSLGMVFDKAILKNGQEIPLNAGIQALASGQSTASAAEPDLDVIGSGGAGAAGSGMAGGGGRSGGGVLGGVGSTAGAAVGTVTNTAANVGSTAGGALNSTANVAGNATGSVAGATSGAVGGLNTAGQLTSNSQGVFGLNGLNLNSAASNNSQGSVITSAGKNVHLASGTQMLLVSQAAAGAQGESKQPSAEKPKAEPKSEREKPNKQ
jgi:hypothetical protein